eukprot:1394803-Amorphochlora_amoeboformis.AAC.1
MAFMTRNRFMLSNILHNIIPNRPTENTSEKDSERKSCPFPSADIHSTHTYWNYIFPHTSPHHLHPHPKQNWHRKCAKDHSPRHTHRLLLNRGFSFPRDYLPGSRRFRKNPGASFNSQKLGLPDPAARVAQLVAALWRVVVAEMPVGTKSDYKKIEKATTDPIFSTKVDVDDWKELISAQLQMQQRILDMQQIMIRNLAEQSNKTNTTLKKLVTQIRILQTHVVSNSQRAKDKN